jgi:hypothetical protein
MKEENPYEETVCPGNDAVPAVHRGCR